MFQSRSLLFLAYVFTGLALVLALSACDSGGDDDDDDNVSGSFSLNIMGNGLNESLSGAAFFGEDTDGAEAVFVIYFGDGDEATPDEIDTNDGIFGGFVRGSGGGVAAQTYGVGNAQTAVAPNQFTFIMSTEDGNVVYFSQGGTLTITSISDDVIEGTFSVQTTQAVDNIITAGNLSATGTFRARSEASFDEGGDDGDGGFPGLGNSIGRPSGPVLSE